MSKNLAKYFFVFLLFQPAKNLLFAQERSPEIAKQLGLTVEMASHALKNYPSSVPGITLGTLLPREKIETTCFNKPGVSEDSDTEILLIIDTVIRDSSSPQLRSSRYSTDRSSVDYLYNTFDKRLDVHEIKDTKELLTHFEKSLYKFSEDYKISSPSIIKGSILSRGILEFTFANQKLSESELINNVTFLANNFLSTDEEKIIFLQIFGDQLYENYNETRNPMQNKGNDTVPTSDMSFNQIVTAAHNGDKYGGGVCNDISEMLAIIGEKIFPNQDVLTVNEGSHFATLITNGQDYTVIDGGKSFHTESPDLFSYTQTPNLRISKVSDGKLKELAVVDSQLGVLLNDGFGKNKKILANDENFSKVMVTIKKSWKTNNKKEKEFLFSAAQAELSRQIQTTIVTAQYNKKVSREGMFFFPSRSSSLGLGSSIQAAKKFTKTNPFSIHLRAGIDHTIIRYKSDKAQVLVESAVMVDSTTPLADQKRSQGISGSLGVNNKVKIDSKIGNTSVTSEVGMVHELGSSSWGESTGKFSEPKIFKNIFDKIGSLSFHLNQVYADISTSTPINKKMTLKNSVSYQGSKIGQSIDVVSGIEINYPNTVKVNSYIGYNTDFKGFETKYNLLGGETPGLKAGATFQKNKMNVGVEANGIGRKTTVSGKVVLPLNKKKKKEAIKDF